MHRFFALFAAPLVVAACSSTYHPEYHPVSVSTFSQNLAYPVTVHNAGNPAERSPVIIAPAPYAAPGTVVGPTPEQLSAQEWFREFRER